jgi:hypothetical protein
MKNQEPKPIRISNMVKLVDALGRGQFKAEQVFKEKEYTDDQKDMLEFYEPAARMLVSNRGQDPDRLVDCLSDEETFSGLPNLYRVPAWHLVVDLIHEVYGVLAQATVNHQRLNQPMVTNAPESAMGQEPSAEVH